jgi:ComF family protein
MRSLLRGLFDLALPPICAGCAQALDCEAALCGRCDRELSREVGDAPPLLSPDFPCTSAVAYEGAAVDWLQRFKYPRPGLSGLDPAASGVVHAWMVEASRHTPGPRPDLVVPIALHPRRLRSRGFNPAALLARALARSIGAACDPVALERVRDTVSQTGLGRRARTRNLANAFRAHRRVMGIERVWLVDDVVTTGSTAAAAARALVRGGVREVAVVSAARTPLRGREEPLAGPIQAVVPPRLRAS